MKGHVGVTDRDWFELLAAERGLEECNFWQPSGSRRFRALRPGEPFLFKLHAPDNFVVGGGSYAHSTLLPVSLAWEAFGRGNGAATLSQMRARIEKYRRSGADLRADYPIGCILLEEPFFLPRERWVPIPSDWSPNIVQGKGYDLEEEPGRSLWTRVRAASLPAGEGGLLVGRAPQERFGSEVVVRPRLGQGSFRILVTDAYARRCAVTGERTLPVLQAAHIKPYGEGGEHRVDNGLLLRSDLHALFDRGYVTVTSEYRVEVSRRIREEFENGRDYYALHGRSIEAPKRADLRPSAEALRWHNEQRYKG